jgi:hypothetical protein
MANLVTITPLLSGQRKVILHVYIKSDGESGDLVDYEIADPANYNFKGKFFTMESVESALSGFSVSLKFGYLQSGTPVWVIPEFQSCYDLRPYGGLLDRSNVLDGTGKVLLSTSGLSRGDEGTFILVLRK